MGIVRDQMEGAALPGLPGGGTKTHCAAGAVLRRDPDSPSPTLLQVAVGEAPAYLWALFYPWQRAMSCQGGSLSSDTLPGSSNEGAAMSLLLKARG